MHASADIALGAHPSISESHPSSAMDFVVSITTLLVESERCVSNFEEPSNNRWLSVGMDFRKTASGVDSSGGNWLRPICTLSSCSRCLSNPKQIRLSSSPFTGDGVAMYSTIQAAKMTMGGSRSSPIRLAFLSLFKLAAT